MNILLKASAWDPDPLDLKDFGFLDPDPFKYADPRIRIQGGQNITLKPQIWTIKKRDYTNFRISEWFIEF